MWNVVKKLAAVLVVFGTPAVVTAMNADQDWSRLTDGDLAAAIQTAEEGLATCQSRYAVMTEQMDALDVEAMGQTNYDARYKRYSRDREPYRACAQNLEKVLAALIAERTKRVGGTIAQPEDPSRTDPHREASARLLGDLKRYVNDIPPLSRLINRN